MDNKNIICTSSIVFLIISAIVYGFFYLYYKQKYNSEKGPSFDAKKYILLSSIIGVAAAIITTVFFMLKNKKIKQREIPDRIFTNPSMKYNMGSCGMCSVKNKMTYSEIA